MSGECVRFPPIVLLVLLLSVQADGKIRSSALRDNHVVDTQFALPQDKWIIHENQVAFFRQNNEAAAAIFNHGEKSKCYVDLGCVNITNDWYNPIYRPINLLPQDRDQVNTQFMLQTRKNKNNFQYIISDNITTISTSDFDPRLPVVFIVHGFVQSGYSDWVRDMAETLLTYYNYNVIRVNWFPGSFPLIFHFPYTQATANTRLVGLEIAYLAKQLIIYFKVDPAKIHIIGHSLGAHIAGYAGEGIPNMGRITGLDPAGPYFAGMPDFVRLDSTDASFVDVIHTDAPFHPLIGWGMIESSGHIDFYPNGGYNQPGCSPAIVPIYLVTKGIIDAFEECFSCSHLRSIDYFTESLISSCSFVGYECSDVDEFSAGNCYECGDDNSHCAVFGMKSIQYPLRSRVGVPLYFLTDSSSPYCLFHYRTLVQTVKAKKAADWVRGKIWLSLYGEKRNLEDVELNSDSMRFYHGDPYPFLFTSPLDTGSVTSLEVVWDYDFSVLDPFSMCLPLICNSDLYIASVEISDLDYYPEKNRLNHTTLLKDAHGNSCVDIKSGGDAMLYDSN